MASSKPEPSFVYTRPPRTWMAKPARFVPQCWRLHRSILSMERVVLVSVGVRLLNALVVQTSFVPDEYWQSMEVAHAMVFGYGERTWEWRVGLRSALYPALFVPGFTVLKLLGWDTAVTLALAARLTQTLIAVLGDVGVYLLALNLADWAFHKSDCKKEQTRLMSQTAPSAAAAAAASASSLLSSFSSASTVRSSPVSSFFSRSAPSPPSSSQPQSQTSLKFVLAPLDPSAATASAHYALLFQLVSWFTFYTSVRTMPNSVEAALVPWVLILWPFEWQTFCLLKLRALYSRTGYVLGANYSRCSDSLLPVALAILLSILRPPFAVLFVCLFLFAFRRLRIATSKILPDTLGIACILLPVNLIELAVYGEWVFPFWQFFKFNVLCGMGSFYGTHPWYWYITRALPAVAHVFLPLAAVSFARIGISHGFHSLVFPVLIYFLSMCFAGHKELRFLQVFLPLVHVWAGIGLTVIEGWWAVEGKEEARRRQAESRGEVIESKVEKDDEEGLDADGSSYREEVTNGAHNSYSGAERRGRGWGSGSNGRWGRFKIYAVASDLLAGLRASWETSGRRASLVLMVWTRRMHKRFVAWLWGWREWHSIAVVVAVLLVNIPATLYFSCVHQRGVLDAMDFLANDVRSMVSERHQPLAPSLVVEDSPPSSPSSASPSIALPSDEFSSTSAIDSVQLLFLTPCHATPMYSHLHVNVSVTYLRCEPLPQLRCDGAEADEFFADPVRWLLNRFSSNASMHGDSGEEVKGEEEKKGEEKVGGDPAQCSNTTIIDGEAEEEGCPLDLFWNALHLDDMSAEQCTDNTSCPDGGGDEEDCPWDLFAGDAERSCSAIVAKEAQPEMAGADTRKEKDNESFCLDVLEDGYEPCAPLSLPAPLPSHVILFDSLIPTIESWLSANRFSQAACFFHTHLPEGRTSRNICVYRRKV